MDAEESFLRFRDRVREKRPLSRENPNSDWTKRIKVVLGVLGRSSTDVCIFRVPNELRRVNGDAYSPLIVSIGPLIHGGKRDLLAMEEHKWRYMLSFFNRTPDPKITLDECSKAILDVEKRARESYAEEIELDKYDLAEIMLVDGCFILELFLRFLDPNSTPDDRIIHNYRMVSNLQHDLALLENQIPFFILQTLFNIVVPRNEDQRPASTITVLALSFFSQVLNLSKEAITNECNLLGDRHSHLLDLLHKFFFPPYLNRDQEGEKAYHEPEQDELHQSLIRDVHVTVECGNHAQQPKGKDSRGFTKCATKLLEAGIEFKKGQEAHFLRIAFIKEEGDIKIPPLLHIDETTKSLLRNLIAFEQCLGKEQQPISSYAILLGSLIQSSPDLEVLQKQNIITYNLREVEDVSTFFKNISRGVVSKHFYFGELCEKVNAYQKSWWHWHRIEACLRVSCQIYLAEFIKMYFSSLWGFVSFLAALLLLILTIMQTYYAARS